MNLQQIRSLCTIVDRDLRISSAAEELGRSQPSLTRQLQEIETELGLRIFERGRNRIIAVTPEGAEVIAIARRILQEVDNLRRLGDEASSGNVGEFTLATTHTQARYTLPETIRRFRLDYPGVKLVLKQGSPAECFDVVLSGNAELAICTEVTNPSDDLIFIPCYWLTRSIVAPPRHPLLRRGPPTLADVARYPIITYAEGFSGKRMVESAFQKAKLKPTYVMSAIDADVSKAYVELGLGIAILASIAFDPKRDHRLRLLDTRDLFPPSRVGVVLRRNVYLRGYMRKFLAMFAPHLRPALIERALSGEESTGEHDLPVL